MISSPLGKRLKEARLAAKFSQKTLGMAAGIDEFSASARMNHYEKGRHAPDYSLLKRIASILKVPVAYFYAESDELAEWIKLFSQTKKAKRAAILKEIVPTYQNSLN
jgi:transcriptional regulator with XRE-family HTH domain